MAPPGGAPPKAWIQGGAPDAREGPPGGGNQENETRTRTLTLTLTLTLMGFFHVKL